MTVLHRAWPAAVVLLVIAVRYAEPIQDGDLFFHMAYARQMLERGTLRLDHSGFAWMPDATDMLYCAWLAELALYGLWERVGPWSLFALRYAVVVTVVGLASRQARRLGIARSALVPVVVVALVLGVYAGSLVKPELFSLLAASLLAFVLFRIKREPDERAVLRLVWTVPLLVLVWVNTHGAFIMAAPILAAALIGETLNRAWSPGLALPARVHRQLVAAAVVAAVAVVANPYGLAYPRQLVADYVLGARARPDAAWNVAHTGFAARIGSALHPEELAVLMAGVLLTLGAARALHGSRGARVDWMVVLTNGAALPLFFLWGRTTYWWPVVFAPSRCASISRRSRAGAPGHGPSRRAGSGSGSAT